jgi:hypothetical protein
MLTPNLCGPLSCCVVVSLVFTLSARAEAQARFEISDHDTITAVPGLSIYTIRDNQSTACYAVFLVDSARPNALTAATAPPTSTETPFTPLERQDTRPPAPTKPEIPWTAAPVADIPWSAPSPGMRTGGWEYMAESARRAVADPTTLALLTEPLESKLSNLQERFSRVELLLDTLGNSQRFAVWPVPCRPRVDTGKPQR